METGVVKINRAPVLTLWGAVVAERAGQSEESALTLGKAMAGLNAQSKGRSIGVFAEKQRAQGVPSAEKVGLGEELWIEVCGRPVPAQNTENGVRAVIKDRQIDPQSVREYLRKAFGDALPEVREAMAELAGSYSSVEIERVAYSLYEKFRPAIAPGQRGWGQKGDLDLGVVRSLAKRDA